MALYGIKKGTFDYMPSILFAYKNVEKTVEQLRELEENCNGLE